MTVEPLEYLKTNSLPVEADANSLLKLSIFPSSLIFRPFLAPGLWNCASLTRASNSDCGLSVLKPILPLCEIKTDLVYPSLPETSNIKLKEPGIALFLLFLYL